MTTLADRIAAYSRRPTATVRLGGARWRGVLSLSASQQYGQGISGGEVVGRDPPVTITEGETTISWSWGYDGYEVAGFSGVVTRILQRSYPNQWAVQVADPLWLADIRRGDIATDPINTIAASTAITQILAAAGLSAISIPELSASGSAWAGDEWVMGTLTPVSFANTTALAAARRICETLGYWLYCDQSGTARAVLLERKPSDSPTRTLRWGVDFLLAGPPERERDASQVKNRVVVRGANTGVQGAQIRDEWQTGDADRSLEVTYELIEYVNESEAGNASCTAAAKRLLTLWSRQPNVIRIPRLKADPRLRVGQTVAIEAALLGYTSPKPFFIYSLQATLDLRKGDFAQSLVLDGGTGDGGYTTIPPPEASFSWRLVSETLNGVGVIEVFLDGSGSTSFGGEVVSWAWSSATAVQSGYSDTASGVTAMFVYPAATATASITLTVTDTSSKTGSVTQSVTLAGDETVALSSRVISLALGAAWAVSPDGGATWATTAAATGYTLVPEAGGSDLLASDGAALKATADTLASAPTTAATLAGTITALSVTEDNPSRVWAAVGAALYRSIDSGATFALWGTLPATISAILEDPVVLNSVFILAGADMYHATTDTPGTGWTTLYAGPTGATARHIVRGQSGATTWICYTGTFVGSPLQRVEGPISATWDVGVTPQPTEIRAIALVTDERTVYAWDGQGRGWSVASETGIATAITATLAGGETAQHALHDPDDPIVYLATFGATEGTTYKYLALADTLAAFYTPASGQQAHRVGLGSTQVIPARLIVPPWGAAGGDDVIRVWEGAWSSVAVPVAGMYWQAIAVNPWNDQEWLLLGNSIAANTGYDRTGEWLRMADGETEPLWRTTDGGATWAALELPSPEDITRTTIVMNTVPYGPVFNGIGGRWAISGWTGVAPFRSFIWHADGTTVSFATVVGDNTSNQIGAASAVVGQAGDLVLVPIAGVAGSGAYSNSRFAVVGLSNTLDVPAGTPGAGRKGSAIIIPSTRKLLITTISTLYASADYREAQATSAGIVIGDRWLAPLADGSVLAAGTSGVARISGLFTETITVAPSSLAAGAYVETDQATRTVGAALDSSGGYSIFTGTAPIGSAESVGWHFVEAPDAARANHFAVVRTEAI